MERAYKLINSLPVEQLVQKSEPEYRGGEEHKLEPEYSN